MSISKGSPSVSIINSLGRISNRCWRRLLYLKRHTTVWFEITTLLIPGENDSEQEVEALDAMGSRTVRAGRSAPFHRLPSGLEDARDRPPTPTATLTMARRIAMKNGIRYAYTGNVHDPEGGSTFCHHCVRS